MNCRHCSAPMNFIFIDMVNSPPSNSYLTHKQLNESELYYPLKVFVCDKCFLVQIDEYKHHDEIFSQDYAYFSSYSRSWLKHSEEYVNNITARLRLDKNSSVMEIASNDGYLLQYFVQKGIPAFGIEPTANTAKVARAKGVETLEDFFGFHSSRKIVAFKGTQDLIIGNNVLAHVPDMHDFIAGIKIALKESGTLTMEFPHLLNLIKYNQFDTIYHEHYSYLSFHTIVDIFASHGIELYDVEELPTHGGSLRIYGRHKEYKALPVSGHVQELIQKEYEFGLNSLDIYRQFQNKSDEIKNEFISFLLEQRQEKKKVAIYGAAAKGNTLLNYCGIKGTNLIQFAVDASPFKQGKYLPGSHIEIFPEQKIKDEKPDFVIIMPWNIRDEIEQQLSYIRQWGGKFITAIPKQEIF
ncbi:MAG: class I SAM-dependent methyltransferase [Lentisphaerota bacterium]